MSATDGAWAGPRSAATPALREGPSLRVGLVCPYSFAAPGGVQNHVLGLADHLYRQGHRPDVLAPGEVPGPDGEPDSDGWLPAGPRFTSAGHAVPVRYNGSVARVNFGPVGAARVRRWLRQGDFDLVHIHEPVTPSIAMLALVAAEVPVVATFHTATPRSRTMQVAGVALRRAIAKIDAGIAVSESARTVVVQHLGRDAQVVPNGFSFSSFSGAAARSGRWRGGDRPRLSFLGRLNERRKGLDVLLSALPTLLSRFPDLDVVVAGQGERRLPAGCRALGAITDARRAELLASTDVFVAPHLERESFGLVLLEAMASGAPVVASDLDAFTDVLSTGGPDRSAWLGAVCPAGDAGALAHAVTEELRHPDPRRVAAARAASRRYDWESVGPRVVDVYRSTVAPGGAGGSGTAVVPASARAQGSTVLVR